MENRFPLFPPKVLYVSNITQDALLSIQNKSLFSYIRHFSNECFFFFALSIAKKKKSNCRNSTPPTKVPLKNAARKRHGQNSQQKYQIIKLDIYNHYPQYFKATGKSRCWGRGVEIYLCSAILMCLTAANLKTTEHQHCFICGKTMLWSTEDLLSILESPM